MSARGSKGLWITLAFLAVVAAVVFWIVNTGEPFRLVILFDEIGELKKDDPVVWKEFTIGKVEQIEPLVENQIGVTVRLNSDYAGKISRGTEFTLRHSALFGLVGSNAVEVTPPPTPGAPYASGERIRGKSTPKPSLIAAGTKWTFEQWKNLKDETSLALEEFRSSPHGRDIEEILAEVGSLAEEGARQAQKGLTEFRKDHEKEFEEALKKLERIKEEIQKSDAPAARRLGEQIEKLRRK
jgi:ABC-type transporter Mla subunit MlaD